MFVEYSVDRDAIIPPTLSPRSIPSSLPCSVYPAQASSSSSSSFSGLSWPSVFVAVKWIAIAARSDGRPEGRRGSKGDPPATTEYVHTAASYEKPMVVATSGVCVRRASRRRPPLAADKTERVREGQRTDGRFSATERDRVTRTYVLV